MKTIAEEWESYRRETLMPDLTPEQVQIAQIAFYSGATALIAMLMSTSDDEEVADVQILAIGDELRKFAVDSLRELRKAVH